jgi:ferredoxin
MSAAATRTVCVNLDRCEGHGRCYAIAPDLLQPMDDHGHAEFYRSPIAESDQSVLDLAQRAIDSCPEEALSWGS